MGGVCGDMYVRGVGGEWEGVGGVCGDRAVMTMLIYSLLNFSTFTFNPLNPQVKNLGAWPIYPAALIKATILLVNILRTFICTYMLLP